MKITKNHSLIVLIIILLCVIIAILITQRPMAPGQLSKTNRNGTTLTLQKAPEPAFCWC